jgi:hypothetical protein
MPGVSFKLMKADAPTRLADFDRLPSWGDLASKIRDLFTIAPDREIRVAFFKVAQEPVILKNEQDLQGFYKSLDRSSEKIEFVVQDFQVPDGESAFG